MIRFLIRTICVTALCLICTSVYQSSFSETSIPSLQTLNFFKPYPKLNTDNWYISHGWANGPWQSCEWRQSAISAENNTLRLTLSDNGGLHRPIGCGELQSKQKFHYGRYEVRMKAAKGKGLNSSFFTYVGPHHGSDEHDEIDFEFLGKNPNQVEITSWRDGKKQNSAVIDLDFDASESFHTYHFEWRKDSIIWFVDNTEIYRTPPNAIIPIHPSKIFISLWSSAGDTEDWLGRFKYQKPVHAEYEWIRFTPFTDEK